MNARQRYQMKKDYEDTVAALWRTLQPSKAREILQAYRGLITSLKCVVPDGHWVYYLPGHKLGVPS